MQAESQDLNATAMNKIARVKKTTNTSYLIVFKLLNGSSCLI